MSRITRWMDKSLYGDYAGSWDDTRFREHLLSRIGPDSVVLDYGAGRGNVPAMNFQGIAKHVAGVDPDVAIHSNPFLDEKKTLNLPDNTLPFEDSTFDVVFSDNVMEHVTDPIAVLKEVHRVLRPGGEFISKTPNRWHYMPTIASVSPTWFHRFYNSLRGREYHDTFPTAYQCNTKRRVTKLASATGFRITTIERWEGRPEYLRMTAPTYALGYLYERIVNSTRALAQFRCVLMFNLKKIDTATPDAATSAST